MPKLRLAITVLLTIVSRHSGAAFPTLSSSSSNLPCYDESKVSGIEKTSICAVAPAPIEDGAAISTTQEWDAERYRNQHSFVFEFGSSLIDILDPKPGERILDLGCGTGELTNTIAQRSAAVVIGLDADPNMVAAARDAFPDLTFLHADAATFTLNQPVDAIFSNAALHWVTNAEQAVMSMSNALVMGGRLIVEFGGRGNVQKIVQAAEDVLGKQPNNKVWYFPSISEYCSLLEKHGMEVTSAVLFDRPTVLQGQDGIKNWYRMFGSSLLKVADGDSLEQVLDALEQKLKPHLYDGEKWIADYRRIRVVAHKIK